MHSRDSSVKILMSGLSDGHAFTLLATSQNLTTICLIVEGKEEFKQYYNNNNNNIIRPPMGFKYYIAQGSVSESPSFLFLFFFLNLYHFQDVQYTHVIAKFTHVHAKRKFSIFCLLGDIMKASKMPYYNVINLTLLIFLLCSSQAK